MYGRETWALHKAGRDSLERTEMRMMRSMMEIKRIEKIRNEEIRTRGGVANISEKIREARPRCRNQSMEGGSEWTPKDGKNKTEVERYYTKKHEGVQASASS